MIVHCNVTMESRFKPGHTHVCAGNHSEGAFHKCRECGNLFGKASERPIGAA